MMQKASHLDPSGLTDTMWDLIVDSLGAGLIAIIGYFYTRKGEFLLFDRMVHRFVERNPKIFEKRIFQKIRKVKGTVKVKWKRLRERRG